MNSNNNEQSERIFEKIKAVKTLSEAKLARGLKAEVSKLKSDDEVEAFLNGVIARLKEGL